MIKQNIIIQLEKICKQYHNSHGQYMLDNVSFKVYYKDIVAIVGKSGCGKTTLLEIMAGIQQYTTGSIKIYNKYTTHENMYHRNIVLLDSDATLFKHITVYENIYFGFDDKSNLSEQEKQKLIYEYANKLHITHILHSYPNNISSGQQQLVAICRSTLTDNKIILMDEPFDKIDKEHKNDVYAHIKHCRDHKHLTFVIVTHSYRDVRILANKVITVTNGRAKTHCDVNMYRYSHINEYNDLSYISVVCKKITINKQNNTIYLYINDDTYTLPYNICHIYKAKKYAYMCYSKSIAVIPRTQNVTTQDNIYKILNIVYSIVYIDYKDGIYTYNLVHKSLNLLITSIIKINDKFVSIASIADKFLIFY